MNAMTATMSLRVAPVGVRKTRVVRGTAALRAPGNKMSPSRGRAVAARPRSPAPRRRPSTPAASRCSRRSPRTPSFLARRRSPRAASAGCSRRTAALVHPAGLAVLWFATVYAGYTGLQWRRVRTIQEEIVELKATVPVKEMVTASGETEAVALTPAQKETQGKIDELASTRKELVAGQFKDKHFNVGSLLLAFGTVLAVEGGMNTYMRVGKLFPGPHLYAGMGIVCLWAAAAGLVPEMQKGNEKARSAHIALNCVNLALFTWQIPTGLEIVGKVFQFTSWP